MKRLKPRDAFLLTVTTMVICLGGVFWMYRVNLPGKPATGNQSTQVAASVFEQATGKQPEEVVSEIERRFHITLYSEYGATLSGRYTISMDYTPGCRGATACYFGDIFISTSPIATPEVGSEVQIQNGTTAYFVDFKCAASCGAAKLNWQKYPYYYQVALKAASKECLLEVANMLQNDEI